MEESALLVARGIIVPEKHWFGTVTVGIVLVVVGVRVMRPVLFHPQPFASSNEIRSESQKIVDPCLLRGGSVVRVVLNVQSDKGLGNTVDNGQAQSGGGGYPQILQGEKETDVKEGTSEITPCSELASTANNLKDFALDFAFERSIPDILAAVIGNGTNSLHLLEVLIGVVRVDHFVLNGNIVSSEQLDRLAAGMIEILDVVDGTIDNNLGFSQSLQSRNAKDGFVRSVFVVHNLGVALSQAVSVGSHFWNLLSTLSYVWE
mmetsp:Transcript_25821/g.60796  ORF Transcript_25821/g.60796 Transcript_25821/m.60796 type:complete len:261 (-) Transcript_25821:125-907(-)